MAVFRNHDTARNVLTENLLDDLRHSGACLPCANDYESLWNREPLAGYGELTISELDVLLNAVGGISSVQRSFPNDLRALPKFIDNHPLRLLPGRRRKIFDDSCPHFLDSCAIRRFRVFL